MRICTVGDLLLDVVIRLDRPFTPDTDTYGESHAGAGGQAANVIPMPVRQNDCFDNTQIDSEAVSILLEGRRLRPGVEQQGMSDPADPGHQSQSIPEISAEQRLTRDDRCSAENDVRELGDGKQGLADVCMADIIGQHIDGERVEGIERDRGRIGSGHFTRSYARACMSGCLRRKLKSQPLSACRISRR